MFSEKIYGDPLRLKYNRNENSNSPPGLGTIKTKGMICTCQGVTCSCIGKNEAHCVWEEDEKCVDLKALPNNGKYFMNQNSWY